MTEMILERRKERLARWLDASWTTDLYDSFVRRRLEGTCEWILGRAEFRHWISSDFPGNTAKMLWIHGVPGSGKTILCANLVENLSREPHLIAYYFMSSGSKSREDPYVVIRSWISQIVSHNQEARNIAYAKLDAKVAGTDSATRKETLELFQAIAEGIPHCTFVVDGLDECAWASEGSDGSRDKSPEEFLRAIRQSISHTTTRLLVVSRDEHDIRRGFFSKADGPLITPFEYKISTDDVKTDITSFSKDVVNVKLANKSGSFRDQLSDEIANRCDGMFIWVKMLGDELRGGKSERSLQKIVSGTPTALDRLYDKNWDKICNLSEEDRNRAFSILRWTTFALRPLTIEELTEALCIVDDGEISMDDFPDEIDQVYVDEEILNLCGSLVEVRQMETDQPLASMILQPIHFSARQHILCNLPFSGLLANEKLNRSSHEHHHSILARACLYYINTDSVWLNTKTDDATHQFKTYASGRWIFHLRQLRSEDSALSGLVKSFFHPLHEPTNENWRSWGRYFDSSIRTIDPSASSRLDQLSYTLALGDLGTSAYLIEEGVGNIKLRDKSNATPLHDAATKGYAGIAKLLLSKGASLAARDNEGNIPLHHACEHGHIGTVRLLLAMGADLATRNGSGLTPLHKASENGHLEVVQLLLDKGANILEADNEGISALLYAAERGFADVVKLLLGKGADITKASDKQWTPLNDAADEGHTQTVKVLLQHGADPAIAECEGWTPLNNAADNGHIEVVRLLLESGADPSVPSASGWTPINSAAESGHTEVVKLLLDNGADFTTPNKTGWTPINNAADEGYIDIAKLLLEKGADVNLASANGWAPLNSAAEGGYTELLRLLLEKGADSTIANNSGWTPLNNAADQGYTEIVKLLIEDGADATVASHNGWMPLGGAAQGGHAETVQVLLRTGCDVNKGNLRNGLAPLAFAAWEGHTNVMEQLLAHDDIDPNAEDVLQRTPLYYAVKYGKEKSVARLCEDERVHIHIKDYHGMTPLSLAARCGHLTVTKQLLACGKVEINSKDCFGRTALWYARKYKDTEIVDLLLRAMDERGLSESSSDIPPDTGIRYTDDGPCCEVCALQIGPHDYYECGICGGGEFGICLECHGAGQSCLQPSHELELIKRKSNEDKPDVSL